MQFNIPLLPVQIDIKLGIRWRPLPRFRVPLWSLMLMVMVAAAFFAAVRRMSQLGVLNRYHAEQIHLDPASAHWHMEMSNRYAHSIYSIDACVALAGSAFLILASIAVLGRLLNWFRAGRMERHA